MVKSVSISPHNLNLFRSLFRDPGRGRTEERVELERIEIDDGWEDLVRDRREWEMTLMVPQDRSTPVTSPSTIPPDTPLRPKPVCRLPRNRHSRTRPGGGTEDHPT